MPEWVGRPPRLTPQQLEELRAIAQARKALPSNAELAKRFNVSTRTVISYLRCPPKRFA
jgi:DNA-binding CsgD family transcriptional regulator